MGRQQAEKSGSDAQTDGGGQDRPARSKAIQQITPEERGEKRGDLTDRERSGNLSATPAESMGERSHEDAHGVEHQRARRKGQANG